MATRTWLPAPQRSRRSLELRPSQRPATAQWKRHHREHRPSRTQPANERSEYLLDEGQRGRHDSAPRLLQVRTLESPGKQGL